MCKINLTNFERLVLTSESDDIGHTIGSPFRHCCRRLVTIAAFFTPHSHRNILEIGLNKVFESSEIELKTSLNGGKMDVFRFKIQKQSGLTALG